MLKSPIPATVLRWTGFEDANDVLIHLQALVETAFKTQIKTELFVAGKKQQIWGFELETGLWVVVYFYPPQVSLTTLTTLLQIQKLAQSQNFQAPLPLFNTPHRFGQSSITIESYLAGERAPDPHKSEDIQLMAFALAGLHQATCTLHHLPQLPSQSTWQANYFSTSTSQNSHESEWLHLLTRPLHRRLKQTTGRMVISPLFWSPDQLRLTEAKIAAVYGWKQLFLQPELWAVGRAAAHFSHSFQTDQGPPPAPSEIQKFMTAFTQARGIPFITNELRFIEASITWTLAEIALQEQNSDPLNRDWEGSYREALTRHARPYYVSLV
jgi:hypothetical protein